MATSHRTVAASIAIALAACTSSPTSTTEPAPTTVTMAVPQTTTTAVVTSSSSSSLPPPVVVPGPADGVVDLIVTGGPIITMTEPAEAEAMAIDGDRIVAVGDGSSMTALATAGTVTVDLEGRAVFPGFIDAHSHWYQPGRIGDYGPEQINQVLLSRGWTGADELNLEPPFFDQLVEWHRQGRIALRMNAYLSLNTPGVDQNRYYDWFSEYDITPGATVGDRLRFPGVKVFIGADWDRYLKWTQKELDDVIAEYHAAGWQIAAKQINDDSLDMALEAFGAVHTAGDDRRHRLEHALEMRRDQIPRVGELGLLPVIQLGGIESDQALDPSFSDMVSDDGAEAVWPFRDMIDAGLQLVGSMAVIPVNGLQSRWTISVAQMLHGALTGVSEVGSQPWENRAAQLMDIDEALHTITTGAARATFEEDSRGALGAGMLADFVVMSDDLRRAGGDPAILEAAMVAATFIDGVLMWCGFGLDEWCRGFRQPIPTRILDEATLIPLYEGDLGGPVPEPGTEGLIVTASSWRDVHVPDLVFDGFAGGDSFWSSGADPPGWIQVDFAEPGTLEALRFTVFQNPASDTLHSLQVRIGGAWMEVARFEGFTATGDVLEWLPETPVAGVEGFRMTTTQSLSWPEWYEIEIVRPD